MDVELLASRRNRSGLCFDPRTKLAVLVTLAVLILGGSFQTAFYYLPACFSVSYAVGFKEMERCRSVLRGIQCMPAFTRICTSAHFRYSRLSVNVGCCDAVIF